MRGTREGMCDSAPECCVCLDSPREPLHLECGHLFCGECILAWLERRAACPLCNEKVGKVAVDASFSEGHVYFYDLESIDWQLFAPENELGVVVTGSDVIPDGSLVTRVNDVLFPDPDQLAEEVFLSICDGRAAHIVVCKRVV